MEKLLLDFQQFFRQNADSWIQKFDYAEAGPQLLLDHLRPHAGEDLGRAHLAPPLRAPGSHHHGLGNVMPECHSW